MIPLTVADIAGAVDGTVSGADGADILAAVTLDSREPVDRGLFIAVVGDNHDGHDYCRQALAAGNRVCMVSRPVPEPHILVPDTVTAAGRLARLVLDRSPQTTVIGLTGSSGKTTTKDLLRHVFSAFGTTIAPVGSFNNELGLPRTVFGVTDATRYLVAEMGARGIGHIAYLCGIAPPEIGLVLNVGSAHVGEFGGRQAIAQAKGELIAALPASGTAVLFADDPLVAGMAGRGPAPVITFGRARTADVRITELSLDDMARPRVTLQYRDEQVRVAPDMHGEHQGFNVAAAVATGVAAGLPLAEVAATLDGVAIDSRWRMEVTTSVAGVVVINDSYNANPESMAAALRALAVIGGGGRTWAVLGEMRELGDESVEAHDAIGRMAVRLNISKVIAVGEGARAIYQGAAHEGSWGDEALRVDTGQEALDLLLEQVQPGDVVLVKASRAVGLDAVAAGLLEADL